MRLSFRIKIFLTLGAVVCIAIALVLTMAQELALRRFRAEFNERFDRTVTAFRRLQDVREQFVADEVTSLTRGNAQFRTILSTASLAPEVLGLASRPGSADEPLRDANLRLNSLLSGLVLHDRSDIFIVLNASGRLLYSKATPQRWGTDVSGLPILTKIAREGGAVELWRTPLEGPAEPLSPASIPDSLYEIVGEAVTFSDEWHGTVLTGTQLRRETLDEIRAVSGLDIAAYSNHQLVLSTLPPELVAPAMRHLVTATLAPAESGRSMAEWDLGQRRFLAARANFVPDSDSSDPSFVLLQPLDAESAFLQSLRLLLLLVGLGALTIAVGASYGLANSITRPVATLHRAVQRVAAGDFETRVDITSRDELGDLGVAFNGMVQGLRERDLLRRTFDRYVSKGVASEILRNPVAVQVAGARRELTVFFIDIGGFTALSETIAPESVVTHLNQYFEVVCGAVFDFDGTVNQFQGDGVIAFWGAPLPQADHAERACRAALRCRSGLVELQQRWLAQGLRVKRFRIGIHTGEAIAGEIGSHDRGTYTVIGDSVNLASRLEGINKVYGTNTLCSESTIAACGEAFITREIDRVRVVGRRTPVRIFELCGERGDESEAQRDHHERFAAALAHYRAGEWTQAEQSLAQLLVLYPDDGAAKVLRDRIGTLRTFPLADWDGVFDLQSK